MSTTLLVGARRRGRPQDPARRHAGHVQLVRQRRLALRDAARSGSSLRRGTRGADTARGAGACDLQCARCRAGASRIARRGARRRRREASRVAGCARRRVAKAEGVGEGVGRRRQREGVGRRRRGRRRRAKASGEGVGRRRWEACGLRSRGRPSRPQGSGPEDLKCNVQSSYAESTMKAAGEKSRQLALDFRPTKRGGARKGAGRKAAPSRKGFVEHAARPAHDDETPVHVTVRARRGRSVSAQPAGLRGHPRAVRARFREGAAAPALQRAGQSSAHDRRGERWARASRAACSACSRAWR